MSNNYLSFTLPEDSTLDVFDNNYIKIVSKDYYFIFKPKSKKEFNLTLELLKNQFTFSLEDSEAELKIVIITQLFQQGMFKISQFLDDELLCQVDVKVPMSKEFNLKVKDESPSSNHFLKIIQTSYVLTSRESPHEILVSHEGMKHFKEFILNVEKDHLDDATKLFKIVLRHFIESYETSEQNHSQIYWDDHDRFFFNQTRVKSLFQKKPIGATFPFPQVKRTPFAFSDEGQVVLSKNDDLLLPKIFEKRESHKIGVSDNNIKLQELGNFLQLLSGKIHRTIGDDKHYIFPIPGNIDSHELLILNNACMDFPRGVYLFNQHHFVLKKINNDGIDTYMKIYSQIWGQASQPQIVIQVLKHYPSIAWKYSSINLKVMLVEAGGILQTAQLLAAELDLAVCPLGTGPNINLNDGDQDFFEWIPTMEFTLEKNTFS